MENKTTKEDKEVLVGKLKLLAIALNTSLNDNLEDTIFTTKEKLGNIKKNNTKGDN